MPATRDTLSESESESEERKRGRRAGQRAQHHWVQAQLRIGRRLCAVRVPVFRRRDIAWVLELPEAEILNRQKCGERLQARGLTDDQVLAAGALPVVMVGGRRCISPSVLLRHPDVAGRRLREDAIAALLEGRTRAPRADSAKNRPRPLVDDVLRLG